jgi:hypothetical protein
MWHVAFVIALFWLALQIPLVTLGGAFHAGWVSRSGTNQAIKGQTAQYPPAQSCAPGIGPGLSYTPT